MGLVKYAIKGLNITVGDFDNVVLEGFLALTNAAVLFDENKGLAFSTYAIPSIKNAVITYMQRDDYAKKEVVYLEEALFANADGEELKRIDLLSSSRYSIEDVMCVEEEIAEALSIALNCLLPKEQIVYLKYLSGKGRRQIAQEMNLCNASVSAYKTRALNRIRYMFDNGKCYSKVYDVSFKNYTLYISFYTNQVELFSKFFVLSFGASNVFSMTCFSDKIKLAFIPNKEAFTILAIFFSTFSKGITTEQLNGKEYIVVDEQIG